MANNMPQELLKEILKLHLRVEHHLFASTRMPSPFSSGQVSSSTILLVNKRWMRVATPLLYDVVILRSSAQAHALGAAIESNPHLGTFIHKLRIEGCYASLAQIVRHAPHISDFFFTLELYAQENVTGLLSSMLSMNPTRVFLHDKLPTPPVNAKVRKVIDVLCACITQHWSNLEEFAYPYAGSFSPRRHDTRHLEIARALKATPHLHVLWLSLDRDAYFNIPPHLAIVLENPGLRSVINETAQPTNGGFSRPPPHYPVVTPSRTAGQRRLQELLKFGHPIPLPQLHSARASTRHQGKPFRPPFSSASLEVKQALWTRIVDFATAVPQSTFDGNVDIPTIQQTAVCAYRLGEVSPMFKEIVLPFTVRCLLFQSESAVSGSHAVLGTHLPHLRQHVRIVVLCFNLSAPREAGARSRLVAQVRSILEWATNLQLFVAATPSAPYSLSNSTVHSFPTQALALLKGVALQAGTYPGTIWSRFPQLRHLDISCAQAVIIEHGDILPGDALPNLQSLGLNDVSSSCLALFTQLALPSLRVLSLGAAFDCQSSFLAQHGAKIRKAQVAVFDPVLLLRLSNVAELVLVVTPGQQYISSQAPALPIDLFRASGRHSALKRLVLVGLDTGYERRPRVRSAWQQFFRAHDDTDMLPSLTEVHLSTFQWPVTERDIAKHAVCAWAETLTQRGLLVTDKYRRIWQARLRVGPPPATW